MIVLPVAVVFIVIIAVVLSFALRGKEDKKPKGRSLVRDRDSIIREANKRLSTNPKDPVALQSLADLYYSEGDFKKAMRTYQILLDLVAMSSDLDEAQINLRYGLAAMQCEAWSEAYKGLMLTRGKDPENFEVNANLGKLEYMRKNYEKTIGFLLRAIRAQPDHVDSLKFLGMSFYRLKRYSEGIPYLKQAAAGRPDEKEPLFALARSQYELSQFDTAQKIFRHLRADPVWGPSAALYSGSIYAKKREWEEASLDFQIGLKHETITPELQLELKYRLAEAYNQSQQIGRALALLNEIYEQDQGYKDVANQIKRYRELNSNRNLQTYMLAPISEFIVLCRRLTQVIFPKARIKVNDMSVQKSEYVDILAEVKTTKWEDIILFRFLRAEGQVGELFVRDLYAHSKELHAGRGFCLTAGSFTTEAVKFVEARLIDLIDKPALIKLLKTIDATALSAVD